jgi:hypothetical protein
MLLLQLCHLLAAYFVSGGWPGEFFGSAGLTARSSERIPLPHFTGECWDDEVRGTLALRAAELESALRSMR